MNRVFQLARPPPGDLLATTLFAKGNRGLIWIDGFEDRFIGTNMVGMLPTARKRSPEKRIPWENVMNRFLFTSVCVASMVMVTSAVMADIIITSDAASFNASVSDVTPFSFATAVDAAGVENGDYHYLGGSPYTTSNGLRIAGDLYLGNDTAAVSSVGVKSLADAGWMPLIVTPLSGVTAIGMDLFQQNLADVSGTAYCSDATLKTFYIANQSSQETFLGIATSTPGTTISSIWFNVMSGNAQPPNLLGISVGTYVPEPSCLVLLATGLIGLLCYAWRKRR